VCNVDGGVGGLAPQRAGIVPEAWLKARFHKLVLHNTKDMVLN
jgi:hypothetical protein